MKITEDSKLYKFIHKADKIIGGIMDNLSGFFIAAIFVIVLFCVLCRYVLHVSTGGYDEFNTYFLTLVIWAGTVTTARKFEYGHINIDLIGPYIKSEKVKAAIRVVWQILAIITCAVFAKLSWDYMMYLVKRGTTMMGVNFPMWFFILIMFLCDVIIMIYEVIFMFCLIFGKMLGGMPYKPWGFIPLTEEEELKPVDDGMDTAVIQEKEEQHE